MMAFYSRVYTGNTQNSVQSSVVSEFIDLIRLRNNFFSDMRHTLKKRQERDEEKKTYTIWLKYHECEPQKRNKNQNMNRESEEKRIKSKIRCGNMFLLFFFFFAAVASFGTFVVGEFAIKSVSTSAKVANDDDDYCFNIDLRMPNGMDWHL